MNRVSKNKVYILNMRLNIEQDTSKYKYEGDFKHNALSKEFFKNNGYAFEAEPLLPFVEKIFEYKGVKHKERIIHKIKGLESHPIYSKLTLVGWEILR